MIELFDVNKTYETGTQALRNINLTIDDGEFAFIMGRSGSGKSTLFRLLTKEIEPSSGDIIVNDCPLKIMPRRYVPKYRRQLGVVFQDFRLLPDRTVYENVAFAQRVINKSTHEIKESVPEALRLVGLGSKYKSFPDQLSGGERQRVAIARAIINKPAILLCDEPTGNLDERTAGEIMKLLEDINASGTTVVVITHSSKIADGSGHRIITLDKGEIVSDV